MSADEVLEIWNSAIVVNTENAKKSKNPRKRPHVKTTWSTEDTLKLISEVEKHTSIWEYSTADYKDRNKRDEAWAQVAKECVGYDKEECKAKWANIKTGYSHAKQKLSTKSGQGTEGMVPHWPFWSAMQFFNNHDRLKTTESVSTLDFGADENEASPGVANALPNFSTQRQQQKSRSTTPGRQQQKSRSNTPGSNNNIEDVLQNAENSLNSHTEDKWDHFGKFVAPELRDMANQNNNATNMLKLTITTAITDAQMKEYTQ